MLSSCSKVVEFPVPTAEPRNVVNVILTADSSLGGYLYETSSIISNDSAKPIANASMLIKNQQGLQVAYQLLGKDGAYFSSNTAQTHNCYHVEFNSGYGVSKGTTCIPNKPIISIVDSTIIKQLNDTTFDLNITIEDTSSTIKNFYRISCLAYEIESIKVNINGMIDTNYGWVTKVLNTRSFNYLINEYNYTNTGYLLRDDKFNGNSALLNFTFSISGTRKFKFRVDAIDENLFEYYRTSTAQQFVQNDPNAHYINVFSNISNGYGIVGSKNSWEFSYTNN
jgi:hypothetical protein